MASCNAAEKLPSEFLLLFYPSQVIGIRYVSADKYEEAVGLRYQARDLVLSRFLEKTYQFAEYSVSC
jgi:hypothetical protein